MPRQNQWFVPGDGIAREVITADIQRYLGPDALVRPGDGTGEHEGLPGYWITAYRTLTTQMITDLKLDSQRWRAEAGRGSPLVRDHRVPRQPDTAIVAYRDSKTHESRQYYGPTTTGSTEYPQSQQPPQPRQQAYPPTGYPYGAPQESSSYTHQAPPSGYPPGSYQIQYTQPPRTAPQPYPYAHQQASSRDGGHAAYEQNYAHYGQQAPEPPRSQAYPPGQSVASPGFYIASDGRQYPLSQQPQSNTGRRRN